MHGTTLQQAARPHNVSYRSTKGTGGAEERRAIGEDEWRAMGAMEGWTVEDTGTLSKIRDTAERLDEEKTGYVKVVLIRCLP